MEPGAAPARPTAWRTATVVGRHAETPRAASFRLRLGSPPGHLPGQHFVVRLTAPDGYTASRSYSVASAPDGTDEFEITVERLADGEVSGFLHDEVAVGDELEVRGPLGGYFVWTADEPALLVGGGSGVVPLMSMLRYARLRHRSRLVRLVVSVRSPAELYYRGELEGPETTILFTREAPAGAARAAGRISAGDLGFLGGSVHEGAGVYVSGSAGFVEAASQLLVDAGVAPERIRTERFGPTG